MLYKHNIFLRIVITIIIMVIIPYFVLAGETNWKLEKNKNGVMVYTRSINGSSYKEFKAVTTVKSSLAGVVAIFSAVPGFTGWMDLCTEAKTLKKISDLENIGYYVSDAPWPCSDRDMVTHSTITQDTVTKAITINMEGMPDYIPSKSGLVRIPKLRGFWKFVPKPGGTVEVTFQLHAELGGSVPAWLANYSVVDNPFNTLVNFSEEIKKDKYQLQKFPYIKE
jgi:hypothetical protein